MDRVGREHLAHRVTPRLLIRGLLLAAVLAGIFGMHVLTADDGASGHGALPMIAAAGHDSGMTMNGAAASDPEAMSETTGTAAQIGAAATVVEPDPGSGMDHGAMAGCILFLVAGAAALIFALLRNRRAIRTTDIGRLADAALTDLRRRGPPGQIRPRIALCVIRI